MNHKLYELSELIENDDFIAWVLHPDESSNHRWRDYLATFPEAKPMLQAARNNILKLTKDAGQHQPTPAQSRRMWQVVESTISEKPVSRPQPRWRIGSGSAWRVAASISLVVGIGLGTYWYVGRGNDVLRLPVAQTAAHAPMSAILQRINDTKKPMTIILTDGSSVVLLPGGTLSYSTHTMPNKREVTLIGRAFFEIVKDSTKPFFVYTDGVTTRVLGTSFLVDAPAGGEAVEVNVKTGRVAVFPHNAGVSAMEEADFETPKAERVVVNPNERIKIFRTSGKPVQTMRRAIPQPVAADISEENFVFDETPVSTVFTELEKAYNVQINYDRKSMGTCPLNATLMGEPLAQKLTVICAALEAEFTIDHDQITIKGRGCR